MSVSLQTLEGRVANWNDMSERCIDSTLLVPLRSIPSWVCFSFYMCVYIFVHQILGYSQINKVMAWDQIPLKCSLPLCFPTVWTNEKHLMWIYYPLPSDIHHRHFIYFPVISNNYSTSAWTNSSFALIKMVSYLRSQQSTQQNGLKGKTHASVL